MKRQQACCPPPPYERQFCVDCTVRQEGDAVVLTFLRGADGDDVAEVWIPANKAGHAAVALLEILFGVVRAGKIEGRIAAEWEARHCGVLPEAEQADFDEVLP